METAPDKIERREIRKLRSEMILIAVIIVGTNTNKRKPSQQR